MQTRRKPPSPDALNPVPLFVIAVIIFVVFAMAQFIGDEQPATAEQELEAAVLAYDLQGVQIALTKGAQVNHRFPWLNYSVLHSAAWRGQTDIMAVLLEHGGDPNQRDSHAGETPLHAAVRGNHPGVVAQLLEAGADPGIALQKESAQCISGLVYPAGSTAMDIARRAGYQEVLAILQSQ